MARRPTAGISGLAVLFGVGGLYLTWAGIRDVPIIGGLQELLQGRVPQGQAGQGGTSILAPGLESAEINVGLGALIGPIPESATRTIPGTGIKVNRSIYNQAALMVAAARQAGVILDGWGWRSVAEQRRLRAEHGYTSDDQPSGSGGRTPVARPGRSMHERGLAIDFKGMSKGDREWTWLSRNAGRFGFYNLPSEPWHWSTTGS